MYLLGYDIGSSFIKAALLDARTGKTVSLASFPDKEMEITAPYSGWAEQDPQVWWNNLKIVTKKILANTRIDVKKIKAIGISYQMHGLVMVDKKKQILRNSIIWCDSRAVDIGEDAYQHLGQYCRQNLLNSPGNFTASKIKWVKDHEPDIFSKIDKIMLPGDYIVMRLTGLATTTPEGLSEAILWDFEKDAIAEKLLEYYGIAPDFIPTVVPNFSVQGTLTSYAEKELGLPKNIPVTYRAGDQPNNAFSLNVLEPNEVAATAGTSGVIYGVSDHKVYEEKSRVNIFLHVNHANNHPRYGVLLCINGTAIAYNWLRKNLLSFGKEINYKKMDQEALKAPLGSNGLLIFPFGNGAERMLDNRNVGCKIINLQFNTHTSSHFLRAVQEGIVFSLKYGLEIMKKIGIKPQTVKAGYANMFRSRLFCQTFANVINTPVELYKTDGSCGAARACGYGLGFYKKIQDAYLGLERMDTVDPEKEAAKDYQNAYALWLDNLNKIL